MLTRIINGKVWIKDQIVERDIIIEGVKIKKIIKKTEGEQVDRIIDAKGDLILPGLIDAHAHLRDGNLSYKEDFSSGTRAAIAGGFTLVIDMPNTNPPVSNSQRLIERKTLAHGRIYCDVGFLVMPTDFSKITQLSKSGCLGFKVYTHRVFEDANFSEGERLRSLFKEAMKTNRPISIHAEDPKKIHKLPESYDAEEHSKAHPKGAEIEMIKEIIKVASDFPIKVRICHISTAEGLQLFVESKRYNSNLFSEVTPAHLALETSILRKVGKLAVVEPPIREFKDVLALRKGVWDGAIDVIGTDHAPHTLTEKLADKPSSGFPGFETAVPILFTLAKGGFLPLSNVVKALTEGPAKLYGLIEYGSIDKDKVANLTFIKFVPEYLIDSSKSYSKAKFSPFNGFKAEAIVTRTIVRGETVFTSEDGVIDLKNGKIVER
ncbi:MAG: dihydroorotase family protein [Nitrososphaeria archaeon]